MALPLDDVQSIGHKSKDVSAAEIKSARVITEAVSNRVHTTGESVARPHQVVAENSAGGLAKIGLTEELRIFGHGQTTHLSGNVAVQIGGYTPGSLAQTLIDMGLPVNYQGEIYLSGCLTAVGPNHGFLGNFYQIIKNHCGGCKVRGNLGKSTTFPDGTQGVWTGGVSEQSYKAQIALFTEMANENMAKGEAISNRFKLGTISLDAAKIQIAEISEQMTILGSVKNQYNKTVYDTTGAYTVTLPDGSVQAENAINAVVSGAVTSASDVDALMDRIDETNLQAAKNAIGIVTDELSRGISSLVEKTAELDTAPIKFNKPKR